MSRKVKVSLVAVMAAAAVALAGCGDGNGDPFARDKEIFNGIVSGAQQAAQMVSEPGAIRQGFEVLSDIGK